MAGLVFLLVFWALARACQRHDVGEFIVQFIIIVLQARYGVTLVGRVMGSEFDIRPLREASAFGVGIDRCVVVEIVAHKNGSQGENELTAQLQVLKILSRQGIRINRRSTRFPRRTAYVHTWRSSRKQLAFHAVAKIAASIDPKKFQTGRLHSASMPQFPFPKPGPMSELITARILIAGRISRAASDLSFDVMTKNKTTAFPFLVGPPGPVWKSGG